MYYISPYIFHVLILHTIIHEIYNYFPSIYNIIHEIYGEKIIICIVSHE